MSLKHFKEVRALARECECWVEVGHHLKIRNERGGLIAVAAATPSCHRALANLRSTLRRVSKEGAMPRSF